MGFTQFRPGESHSSCSGTGAAAPATGSSGFASRFRSGRSGNAVILFAMMLVPITAVIGMAVDYGHALSARTDLQAVLDSTALAAGRAYQVSGEAETARAAAETYFAKAYQQKIGARLVRAEVDDRTTTIEVAGELVSPTAFLGIVGIEALPVSATATAALAGAGSDKDLEVALMLDITGSMAGQKLTDLKTAAKDLIQILVPDTQGEHRSRLALIPFSAAVNPGAYKTTVRGPDKGNGPACPSNSTNGWYAVQCYRDSWNNQQQAARTNCVSERLGAEAFTDASPLSPGGRVAAAYGATCPKATVVPLTTDKGALISAVNALKADGWTAGQIGTAWAWYTLSPNWNDVWPAASQPAPYNSENLYKIAVLMTDGEYNTDYANYVRSLDQYRAPAAPNGASDQQARQLCEAMKDEGIIVYTVGFQLDNDNAEDTLSDCATDASHAFLAENGTELKEAFREIAFRLARLRLTK